MVQESDPRIDERPATHKKKMQTWLFAAVGLVLLVLGTLMVINIVQQMGGGDDAAQASEAGTTKNSEDQQPDREPSRAADFDRLVDNRTPSRNLNDRPSDAFSQLQPKPELAPVPAPREGQEAPQQVTEAPQETREEKALSQWKAREQIRALNSARAEWGFESASDSAGSMSDDREAYEQVSRPLSREGSIEQRRQEVRDRIEEAKKLRQKLLADAKGGAAPAQMQQTQQSLQQVTQQFDEAPENVAGYTAENTYNADIAGKMKLPPGTIIPAVFAQKAISDYDGSTLKGIVDHDVYDISSEYVLIPKGTEIIMKVNRIQNVNEPIQARMGITVEKGVLPDGKVLDFSKATGMDREGVGAIKDQVNYHFMAQFLGVAAYALVSSESSREGSGLDNDSTYAGEVGQSMREQFAPLAQRYINLVPTITIRPGQSFRIMLEESLYVEPWKDLYAQYVN
ncbi:hypothetical protein RE428_48900 (plasmid) [Marinobacter nanhaiticus D15-8W]|uniref:Conjugal transfer protein TrbI n=1 Tax=Marinobacter nanhaiticus D15-8W TaxID=626887 RepID=N6WA85_9GAMM|nr:TrbI/VirB10 family protein [Marinobacter nanhaiticus]ENO17144.1 hypothetical protein J057_00724 [Marinobacter nanhaiticus D15-8W]BES73872.1 hypothetical protein RE428_48900 [Marinobacter nanhaiticus D15-8W]